MNMEPALILVDGDARGFDDVQRASDSPLNAIIENARQLAAFDVPVLINGETGVGKAEIARAIHNHSRRAEQPFVAVNCLGMSEELLMAELVGGDVINTSNGPARRAGFLRQADGGTLYLSGVETLGPRAQMMLARVAGDGCFQPMGAQELQHSDLRLITGAQSNLHEAVAEGVMRQDLFYALSTTEISLPPLRRRLCDLKAIAQQKLDELSARYRKPVSGLSDLALEFLSNYTWPGNLLELENELARMLIASQSDVLGPELISRHILQAEPSLTHAEQGREMSVLSGEGTLKERVEIIEIRILRETLTRLKWNKSRAASELGLSRVGLRAKLDRYGVFRPEDVSVSEQGES